MAAVHPSRREFLAGAASIVAMALVGTGLSGCEMVEDLDDPDLHLLRRATFGLEPNVVARIRAIGPTAWLAEQLDPGSLDRSAVEALVAQMPAVGASAATLIAEYRDDASLDAAFQLQIATAIRQVQSPAQLYERMVEFWSDHFNVAMLDENLRLLKVIEDRDVIRPLAFGRFADLLVASATSPAMLVYLDGARSFAGAINENYGRELLELHTVGVEGGYDEDDVVALARLLTGWSVDENTGAFLFRSEQHDPGPLTIMEWERPTGGDPFGHGLAFLDWIAHHRSTAEFLATKLARRFVSDDPDQALVSDLADAYLANDTAVVPVLQAMFAHPTFSEATHNKMRRPHDWLVAACRAGRASMTPATTAAGAAGLGDLALSLGQPPFLWPAPNGYPDVAGPWLTAGGMLARWNGAGDLVGGAVPLIDFDLTELRSGLAGRTVDEAIDELARRVLFEPLTEEGRQVLRAHTGLEPATVLSTVLAYLFVGRVLPLMLSTPDFQYR